MNYKFHFKNTIVLLTAIALGCDDFVNVDSPRTELVRPAVFDNATTAEAAVVELYTSIRKGFGDESANSISGLTAISSDEYIYYGFGRTASENENFQQFGNNDLSADNLLVEIPWRSIYNVIYKANAVIEGLSSSDLPINITNQLLGEAMFIRSFCYFYLVNLWGDVPLALTSDYTTNNLLDRTTVSEVYDQIVMDLLMADDLLAEDYGFSNGERVRANKGAALALLARVYLYREAWVDAEATATQVIDGPLYSLEGDPEQVFRVSSPEAIFQLWSFQRSSHRSTFFISSRGPRFGVLSDAFLEDLERDDKRWAAWGQTRIYQGVTYNGVLKYDGPSSPPLDYTTILRLAEQYLIRAEARAHQDELIEAANDLNIIRTRAGLPNTMASTKEQLLDSIIHERKYELYTEWGHRWLDLKRTGKVNEVLAPLKPLWNSEDVLYPIPEAQLISNRNMKQNNNPG